MRFSPRKTEIRFSEDGRYGIVDFGATANVADDEFNRFGAGEGPLQSVGGGGGGTETPPGETGGGGGGGGSCPMAWEDFLTADTSASATLEAWTDLPGLTRTLALPRRSLLVLHAVVQFSGDDFNENVQSEVRARILVNDVPIGPTAVWSITANALGVPGKTEKAQGQLVLNTTYLLSPAVNYTIKVQIANFFAAATFTALVGTGAEASSNLLSLAFCTTDKGIEQGQPKPPPATVEANNWVKILDFSFDDLNDEITIARVRGEFDDGIPEVDLGTDTGPWSEEPDRAYLEVVGYSYAAFTTAEEIPILSGTVRYKRQITASLWQDYYSVLFEKDADSGRFVWCFTADEAGATVYSRTYYLVMGSHGGSVHYDAAWDGPNWNDYESDFGSAVFDGSKAYLVIPTDDTTAESGSAPYKSGWRVCTLDTDDNAPTLAELYDVVPQGTEDRRSPITLTHYGGNTRLWFNTQDGLSTDILYEDPDGGISAGTSFDFGGFLPEKGMTIHPWSATVPVTWLFIRQGFNDIYEIALSGSETEINNDFYNGKHDTAKIDVNGTAATATHFLLFIRGVQGCNDNLYYDGSGGMDPAGSYELLAEAWLVRGIEQSPP